MAPKELRCPNCGAYYKKEVPKWVSYVKCEYCGATIPVPSPNDRSPIDTVVVYVSPQPKKKKEFDLREFCIFLSKKGFNADPGSGAIEIAGTIVYVDEEGNVDGPEPYKTKIEKWIYMYMNE